MKEERFEKVIKRGDNNLFEGFLVVLIANLLFNIIALKDTYYIYGLIVFNSIAIIILIIAIGLNKEVYWRKIK